MRYQTTFRAVRGKDEAMNRNLAGIEDQFKRLSNTINEQDIMAKKPWVDVRGYGAKGDGVTDDTAAIQAAINSLIVNGGTYAKGTNQYKYSACKGGGVVYFPPNHNFIVSSPLSVETDYTDTANRLFADRIVLWGYGSTLKAKSTFSGATRYYDATNTETINAMVIMGVKSYGKYGGYYQTYNGVYGLGFDGSDVSAIDLTAVRGDMVIYPLIKDCIFADLHKAIDGRVISLAQVANCRATYVNSFYCAINNSEALGWNGGLGIDSGGPHVSDVLVHFSKNYTNSATYNDLGKIHLINVGEELVNNVKIMGGGGKGVYREYNASTHQHYRWGHYNNMEVAGVYYHALHLKNVRQINFDNCQFIWNQAQPNDTTDRPIVFLEDVKRIGMMNVEIDQTAASKHCSNLLHLKGGACRFIGLRAFGLPYIDNTYDCILLQDGSAGFEGDNNSFSSFEFGDIYYTAGNRFRYGIYETAGLDYNKFIIGHIRNCATGTSFISGANSEVAHTG